MNKGNWIWTKSGKPEADWGKDFDQIFGGNLWREGDYKHKYTGEGSMWTTCGEDVKEFIAKQIAQAKRTGYSEALKNCGCDKCSLTVRR